MKNQLPHNVSNRPTTNAASATSPSVVFKGSMANSAAIYRSLELPLPIHTHSPLAFPTSNNINVKSALPPMLKQQTSKTPGEVAWAVVPDNNSNNNVAAMPPPVGLYCGGANSFSIKLTPTSVQEVNRALDKANVDVSMYNAFEWTCSYLADFIETSFVVRLFNNGMVDCQRECGCPIQFNNVFAQLKQSLTGATLAACEPSSKRAFKPLALPKEMEVETSAPVSFKPLMDMCCSPNVEIQREGLTALTHLLAEHQHNADVPCQKLVDMLAQAKDGQVKRLCASCINLVPACGEATVGQEQAQHLVKMVWDDQQQQEGLETRRQVGKALCRLAAKPSNKMVLKNLVINSAKLICPDAQLNDIVNDLRQMMM